MRSIKFLTVILAIIIALLAIFFVLASENALVLHPKGIVAQNELELIITNIVLMLIIIVPTYLLLFRIHFSGIYSYMLACKTRGDFYE